MEKYQEFYYNRYGIQETAEAVVLQFEFEVPNLAVFRPKIEIPKGDFGFRSVDSPLARKLAFHIGMVELVSYWKATCSPKVFIRCGFLNEEQIKWWKKLYFYGLGELFYRNGIRADFETFMEIRCDKSADFSEVAAERWSGDDDFQGYIVPVGGGKDSNVTLETLKLDRERDYVLIINPKPVTMKCAELAGFRDKNIIKVYREIDLELFRLNREGFINGHTPFSTMLAFLSYFVAFLTSRKYIALSNESSANESNIRGKKINHQYSKSFEFEEDFRNYVNKYFGVPAEYFSFLRPLNELQIAKIFAKLKKYHPVFKSCNVGSKSAEWKWCANCSKCLFVFIILSPFLSIGELVRIFGENLFEKESLLTTFLELTGNGETKPFDCVGTFEEVNFAVSRTIQGLLERGEKLPYLLEYYREHYGLVDTSEDITLRYNSENNLNAEQEKWLKEAVFDD